MTIYTFVPSQKSWSTTQLMGAIALMSQEDKGPGSESQPLNGRFQLDSLSDSFGLLDCHTLSKR